MQIGTAFAWAEITLVLFTAVTPAGIFAYCATALCGVLRNMRDEGSGDRALRYLGIPFFLSIGGFIASATHLGDSANVLYVLSGVGRSPLSNEVLAAVLFFGLSGSLWFYSFALKPRRGMQAVWAAATCVSGAVFLAFMALAYLVPTIAVWYSWYPAAAMVLSALVAGPGLALFTLHVARAPLGPVVVRRAFLGVSLVAVVVSSVLWDVQWAEYSRAESLVCSVAELVPLFPVVLRVSNVLCAAGVLGVHAAPRLAPTRGVLLLAASGACALCLAGIALMRFEFYAMT